MLSRCYDNDRFTLDFGNIFFRNVLALLRQAMVDLRENDPQTLYNVSKSSE